MSIVICLGMALAMLAGGLISGLIERVIRSWQWHTTQRALRAAPDMARIRAALLAQADFLDITHMTHLNGNEINYRIRMQSMRDAINQFVR